MKLLPVDSKGGIYLAKLNPVMVVVFLVAAAFVLSQTGLLGLIPVSSGVVNFDGLGDRWLVSARHSGSADYAVITNTYTQTNDSSKQLVADLRISETNYSAWCSYGIDGANKKSVYQIVRDNSGSYDGYWLTSDADKYFKIAVDAKYGANNVVWVQCSMSSPGTATPHRYCYAKIRTGDVAPVVDLGPKFKSILQVAYGTNFTNAVGIELSGASGGVISKPLLFGSKTVGTVTVDSAALGLTSWCSSKASQYVGAFSGANQFYSTDYQVQSLSADAFGNCIGESAFGTNLLVSLTSVQAENCFNNNYKVNTLSPIVTTGTWSGNTLDSVFTTTAQEGLINVNYDFILDTDFVKYKVIANPVPEIQSAEFSAVSYESLSNGVVEYTVCNKGTGTPASFVMSLKCGGVFAGTQSYSPVAAAGACVDGSLTTTVSCDTDTSASCVLTAQYLGNLKSDTFSGLSSKCLQDEGSECVAGSYYCAQDLESVLVCSSDGTKDFFKACEGQTCSIGINGNAYCDDGESVCNANSVCDAGEDNSNCPEDCDSGSSIDWMWIIIGVFGIAAVLILVFAAKKD